MTSKDAVVAMLSGRTHRLGIHEWAAKPPLSSIEIARTQHQGCVIFS